MSAPASSGSFRGVVEAGRTLLSNAAAFQTLVGAANAAEALAFINRDVTLPETGDDEGEQMALPLARIWSESGGRTNVALGTFATTGALRIVILAEPPEAYASADDGEAWMSNLIGDIVDEMAVLVSAGGYLWVREFSFEHPEQQAKDDDTEYWRGSILAAYGVTG